MPENQIVEERKEQMPLFELEKFIVSQAKSIKLKKLAEKEAKDQLDRILDEDEEYRTLANAYLAAGRKKREKIEALVRDREDVQAAKEELDDAREDLKSVKAVVSDNLSEYSKRAEKDTIPVDGFEMPIKKNLELKIK